MHHHKEVREQKGTAMIEYGLIVALIALVVVAAIILIGQNAQTLLANILGSF